MKTQLITIALFLTACSTADIERIRQGFSVQRSEPEFIDNRTDVEICEAEITNPPKESNCDLIFYSTLSERPKVFEACLKSGKKQGDCDKIYGEMVIAKLSLKYPYANWNYVETWCKSEPILCDSSLKGLGEFETKLKETHLRNKNIRRQEMEQAEADARLSRAVKINAIMNSYRPTNCTSTRLGNTVNTSCY